MKKIDNKYTCEKQVISTTTSIKMNFDSKMTHFGQWFWYTKKEGVPKAKRLEGTPVFKNVKQKETVLL